MTAGYNRCRSVTNYYFPLSASQPFTRPTKITAGLSLKHRFEIPCHHNLTVKELQMTKQALPQEKPQTKYRDIHQEVTDTIISQLEKGTIPWRQPWQGQSSKGLFDLPYNMVTNNHYQGINIVLLWGATLEKNFDTAEWATFKQWSEKKESIRKGEKGSMIVYYDFLEKEDDKGELQKIPYLKSYYVFNRCQLNSYNPQEAKPETDITPLVRRIEVVDSFVENTQAVIEHGAGGAFYRPSEDKIYMPKIEAFQDTQSCTATEGYYSTLLHELVHWSGAPKRLDRAKSKRFGDNQYAVEELVAELGSAFLCAEYDIGNVEKGDHANYIASWLKVLKDNKYCIVSAASEASKAVNYMKQLTP